MANFGITGLDWQQRINWDRLRTYRLERARERMKAHGLSAMLLMYDENVRYVTSTLTPGWNRLKPGLRYAMLCGDDAPVLFEQGDLGMQVQRHSPWLPKDNVRWSYAWIKGAAGQASTQQVKKFTNAIIQEMKKSNVAGGKLGATTREIASKWPSAMEAWGYEEEDQAAANLWGHGLGLAQYDQPVISRIWSLDHPVEIKAGMVFALETQHGKKFEWGVRIEEMLIVHDDNIEIISNFPVEQITVVDPLPGYSTLVKR